MLGRFYQERNNDFVERIKLHINRSVYVSTKIYIHVLCFKMSNIIHILSHTQISNILVEIFGYLHCA